PPSPANRRGDGGSVGGRGAGGAEARPADRPQARRVPVMGGFKSNSRAAGPTPNSSRQRFQRTYRRGSDTYPDTYRFAVMQQLQRLQRRTVGSRVGRE